MNLDTLSTETPNPKTADLDLMTPMEFVKMMNHENTRVFEAVEKALPNIAKTIEIVARQFKAGGRLIYAGAGTSGRIGLMDAVECVPTFGVDEGMVVGLIAGGQGAFVKAVEGAEDSKGLCVADLKALGFSTQDVLVGIAASGRTPYVIGGLEYANALGAETVAVACNYQSAIGTIAKTRIEVDAGSELLTGSTRLKAGTAQKIILNMISTGAMIRIGKVYRNLMIDLRPTNQKLVDRARRIVMQVTGVDYERADAVLKETNNQVKLALVMLLQHCDVTRARAFLKETDGHLPWRRSPSGSGA
jgi:N-acetylmuramic acid 6-phosphate etherase